MSAEVNAQSTGNPIIDRLDLWSSVYVKKATTGRGSNGKISPYGIQKLRELILELAVRGQLVPQDPNDEPASALLERIALKKNDLVKAGKVKSFKKLANVAEEETTHALPASWEWARFGHIAQHNAGKTLDRGRNSGVAREYITTSNLYWGFFDLNAVREMLIREDELEKCTATKGDLLICEGGEAGRAAVWSYDSDICFQNHVHRARLFGAISPYYIYRVLECLSASGEIEKYRKGVGISNMSGKALASIPVPLPPIAEQHRIVAKVDGLMALCDQLEQQQTDSLQAHQTLVETLLAALVRPTAMDGGSEENAGAIFFEHFDTLFTTEESIDQLKQTILQLAVMGRLVPQDPNDEPASVLLEKVTKDKIKAGKKGNAKIQRMLHKIADAEKPFDLPLGWAWEHLGNLGEIQGGGTPNKSNADYWGGSIPWITPKDMKVDFITESQDLITQEAVEQTTIKNIPENSLLMVVRGMILSHSFPVSINTRSVTVNQDMKAVSFLRHDPKFILHMMKGLKNDIVGLVDRSSHGTCKLVSEKLWNRLLGIPPLNEQHRIVAKVDELMALCDTLKTRIQEAQATQVHLADAVVEQAVA